MSKSDVKLDPCIERISYFIMIILIMLIIIIIIIIILMTDPSNSNVWKVTNVSNVLWELVACAISR